MYGVIFMFKTVNITNFMNTGPGLNTVNETDYQQIPLVQITSSVCNGP